MRSSGTCFVATDRESRPGEYTTSADSSARFARTVTRSGDQDRGRCRRVSSLASVGRLSLSR